MNILISLYNEPVSDELLHSILGCIFSVLVAFLLVVLFTLVNIQLRLFHFSSQLKRASSSVGKVYAAQVDLPESLYGTTITHGDRNKKQIALTFDADMTPGMKQELISHIVPTFFDKRIAEILKQTQTKATFFLTGMWIEQYPDEAKALASNSLFELGNHSYSHPSFFGSCYDLPSVSDKLKSVQIDSTQKLLFSLTGQENHLFRFPGGCYSAKDLTLLKNHQLISILWDVVSGDAFGQDAGKIIQTVLSQVQNGSIVIMHVNGAPTAPKTAEALPEIIKQLKTKDFEFLTISELLQSMQK